MSRIGKKIINIPSGVTVQIKDNLVSVKGPKGSLEVKTSPFVKVELVDNIITVSVNNTEDKKELSHWGLMRTLVANAVQGVNEGYTKQLEINGVGFKAAVEGKVLALKLGFSHPVNFPIPEGINMAVEKNVVTITGFDKQLVGQVAADIRALKKPEPYKGKGIKYVGEVIRRKAGKLAKAGAK